jgi:hypothetical protein
VVLGGQLSATVIAVVLVPVFFVVFQRMGERFSPPEHSAQPTRETDSER